MKRLLYISVFVWVTDMCKFIMSDKITTNWLHQVKQEKANKTPHETSKTLTFEKDDWQHVFIFVIRAVVGSTHRLSSDFLLLVTKLAIDWHWQLMGHLLLLGVLLANEFAWSLLTCDMQTLPGWFALPLTYVYSCGNLCKLLVFAQ